MSDIGLIGKKIGMTREFYKSGQSIPVTVIKMEKGRIIDLINEEKRGYKAIQIGFGKIKNSKISKAMKGYFAKKNTEAKRKLKEFRVSSLDNLELFILPYPNWTALYPLFSASIIWITLAFSIFKTVTGTNWPVL